MESQLASFDNRRGRLLKLYEMGEIDDEYFLRESTTLRAEKAKVAPEPVNGITVF
jgi:hypothetical protein